jgi:hypothetical protein
VERAGTNDGDVTKLPSFEISISRTANLIHWIDNLAGSSMGKSTRTYRIFWAGRFGSPSERERSLLREWRAIRSRPFPQPVSEIRNESGCLPQPEDPPSWRHIFRVRSYEAGSVEEFIELMSADLTSEEIESLRDVLEAFRPRFDQVWEDLTYLAPFRSQFLRVLRDGELTPYLGRMAAFYGVDPGSFPPGRVHLMALPGASGTHAQANGRDLLMEIRPNDTPVEQIQVIAHETAHYFWSQLPPDRRDALARQIHEATEAGPIVWRLLREGLPTALGQGLALAEVAPMRFGFQYRWYHTDHHDRFAKAIYPMVASAFREDESMDQGVLAGIAKGVESLHVMREVKPVDYLMDAAFIVGEGMYPALREVRSRIFVLHEWNQSARSTEGVDFLERYDCLSGVVFLGPKEVEDPELVPALFRPPSMKSSGQASTPSGNAPGEKPSRSFIHMARRPGGGILFYLAAAREEDIPRVATAFLELQDLPEAPVYLE